MNEEVKVGLKGLLVFYFEVGQLSPEKADEFLKKQKQSIVDSELYSKLLATGYDLISVPVRQGQTRVEVMHF